MRMAVPEACTFLRWYPCGDGIFEIDEFDCASCFLVEGTEKALLIDTGVGIGDLKWLVEDRLSGKPYDVVATHSHGDHIGGAGWFDRILIHPADADWNSGNAVPTLAFRREYAELIRKREGKTYPYDPEKDIRPWPKTPEIQFVERGDHVFVLQLVLRGLAYPCFCSEDDLKTMHEQQEANKEYFGYYGNDAAATPNAEILGEILLYDTVLDDATRAGIESYLMKKWTGRLPDGYMDFRGATVTGSGIVRAPTAAALPSFTNFDGTGVVAQTAYEFTLDASATPAVPDALTVPCALALPAACTATVTCAAKPRAGTYTLISAASFTQHTDWSLNTAGTTGNATLKLRATNNALLLDVINPGAAIVIR